MTYTITASNAGPSGVTGATVADTFPGEPHLRPGPAWALAVAPAPPAVPAASTTRSICQRVAARDLHRELRDHGERDRDAEQHRHGDCARRALPTQHRATTGNRYRHASASADLAITVTDGVTTVTPGGSVTTPSPRATLDRATHRLQLLPIRSRQASRALDLCRCAVEDLHRQRFRQHQQHRNLPAGGSVTYTASCAIRRARPGP